MSPDAKLFWAVFILVTFAVTVRWVISLIPRWVIVVTLLAVILAHHAGVV